MTVHVNRRDDAACRDAGHGPGPRLQVTPNLFSIPFPLVGLAGAWLTGQWIVGDLDQDKLHPGYFLPTVAGGLVCALCAAQVHLRGVGEASFGIGILCWLLLGSILLNRLFLRLTLPSALLPTLAIELAPPAVAGLAYFALDGRAGSPVAYILGGYAVLMALVQFRFLPNYARLSFTPGIWAFAFSYAAAVSFGLEWIDQEKPPGATVYASVAIAAITLLIGAIAVHTVISLVRGELLPGPHLRRADRDVPGDGQQRNGQWR